MALRAGYLSSLLLGGLCAPLLAANAQSAVDSVPTITPAGITVTVLGFTRGEDGVLRFNNRVGGGNRRSSPYVYADERGRTLYTYTKDESGSKCEGECLSGWIPLVSAQDTQATGDWSLVQADGGKGRQWAFKGKPVYTFEKDSQPGDSFGHNLGAGAWNPLSVELPKLEFLPFGIEARDVPEAEGMALVDREGKTLYAFSGDLESGKAACAAASCTSSWIAVTAPAIAKGAEDFSIVARPDGTKQWAYKGRPLFKYEKDQMAGEVNGVEENEQMRPALIVRYPMPAQFTLRSTRYGRAFATSEGYTVYRYDIYGRPESNDGARGGVYLPAMGRALGTQSCVGECLKQWKPVVAPTDARPSWYWTVLDREDGTKQWAYNGYALYTFTGDEKPGDMLGTNTWDIAATDKDLQTTSLLGKLRIDYGFTSAFFWTPAYPSVLGRSQ